MWRRPTIRPTIRLKLTAVFGALFVLTSVVLITIAYLFVANEPGRYRFDQVDPGLRTALAEAGIQRPTRPDTELSRGGPPALNPRVEQAVRDFQRRNRQQLLDSLLARSLVAFAITSTGSLALGWWMAGRALAPVDAIADTANRLSEQNLHERLADDGPNDELHRLRASFNAMLGRLETAFDSRRRLAADASHELRTPLAVMRSKADNRLTDPESSERERELANSFISHIERADRIVGQLLDLAQIEHRPDTRHLVDLADIVGDVAGQLAPEADRRKLELRLSLNDATVLGDEVTLERLVSNLLRNAIVHNHDGGWLAVDVDQTQGHTVLRVTNSGPVVDAAELDRLFTRFRQGSAAGSHHGHGLGLAIVRAVADAHSADITAHPAPDGGLELTVTFPANVLPAG